MILEPSFFIENVSAEINQVFLIIYVIQIPIGFFVAIGLLKGIRLAWMLAVIFYLMSLFYDIIKIDIWLIIFNFLIIIYLTQPVVRKYFNIVPRSNDKKANNHSTDKINGRLQIKREHRFIAGIVLFFSGLILFYFSILGVFYLLESTIFFAVVLIVFGILLMLKINVTFP